MFKNSPLQYGSMSKFFHWGLFLLVLIQFMIIFWVFYVLPPKSPEVPFLIGGLHKPIGMLVLGLVVLALIWKALNVRPLFPPAMKQWEITTARLTHNLLYLCLIVMPVSGLIWSLAAGYPPSFFGLFQVPPFIEKNKEIAELYANIHMYAGYLLLALIVLHTLAAFKHHFIDRDNVLKRMLP